MYFKQININNLAEIQSDVLENLPTEAKTMHGVMPFWHNNLFHLPSIQSAIHELNLQGVANYICVVGMSPHTELPVHFDGGKNKAALNIPILNCKGTYTTWYTSTQTAIEYPHHGAATYHGVDKESCTELARTEMNSPIIINVQQFHSAINPHDTWRLLISIRLSEYQF